MPWHRPAGGFSALFSPLVGAADPDCAAGKGELTTGLWVPCVCANLVGIRQVPGDTAGLELRLQLPLGGLLLGRLVWGRKVSRAAVQWGARGQAQGPSGAPARLLLTEHRCGAAAGALSEENRAPHYRDGDL